MYSIFADDICIYDDVSVSNSLKAISPKLALEDNAAGSLNITLPVTNSGYAHIVRMDTDIVVKRDGEEIWAGRVLTEDKDFWKNRVLYCEGELAFLNDTTQPPAEYHEMTVRGFLTALIEIHNSKAPENRQFAVGTVTVVDPNDSLYRYTNYEKTLECINKKLLEPLGGHLRIRKVDGIRYIDYLADYPNTNTQTIEFGKNLMDFVCHWDMTEYATVIVPLGARLDDSPIEALDAYLTVESVNDGSIYVQSAEAVSEHGWIEKVVNWDDVTVPANLKRKAEEYLSEVQFDNMIIELSALDMHHYNVSYEAVKLLDRIKVISRPHGINRFFPVTKLNIPLDTPENTVFTLGDAVKPTLTSVNNKINSSILKTIEQLPKAHTILDEARDNATAMMNMVANGHITIAHDEHGSDALYVTDTKNYQNAVKMWVLNMNGFGYSSDSGRTFGVAITMDGAIVADYITAGTLNGEIIRAGTIKTAAISQEYKNSVTSEIGYAVDDVTQEFTVADAQLLSQVTQDIYDSETRSQTLIRQTEDAIETRAELRYSTKEDVAELEQLFLTYVDLEDSQGNKILDSSSEIISTRTTADGITAVEVQAMIHTSAENVKLEVLETVESSYTTIEAHNDLSGTVSTLRSEYNVTRSTVSDIDVRVGQIDLKVETQYTLRSDFNALSNTVDDIQDTLTTEYYTSSQIDIQTGSIRSSVTAAQQTADNALSSTVSIWSKINDDLEPTLELKIERDDVVSSINMSSDTITLSAGRLVITTGNFTLDAQGNATMANANMSNATVQGTIISGGTSGYRTKIEGGDINILYNNRRSGSIGSYVNDSGIVKAAFLASTNYHGIVLGQVHNAHATPYYQIGLDGDGYNQYECRHYFTGDVKFVDGLFKSNVNFRDNCGIACGGNIAFRYANEGVSRYGVWVGIGNTALVLNGNEIHANSILLLHNAIGGMTDSNTYQEIITHSSSLINVGNSNATLDLRGDEIHASAKFVLHNALGAMINNNYQEIIAHSGSSIKVGNNSSGLYLYGSSIYPNGMFRDHINFANNIGLMWGGNVALRYYTGSSPAGVWLGISGDYACTTYLTGSEIRCMAKLYLQNGSEVTSDRRAKNSIRSMDSRYSRLMDSLDAKLFRYNKYRKTTTNCGFIAQEVLDALNEAGLRTDEFGAFDDVNGDGSEYALDYSQFTAVLWDIVKQLKHRVNEMERRTAK